MLCHSSSVVSIATEDIYNLIISVQRSLTFFLIYKIAVPITYIEFMAFLQKVVKMSRFKTAKREEFFYR